MFNFLILIFQAKCKLYIQTVLFSGVGSGLQQYSVDNALEGVG